MPARHRASPGPSSNPETSPNTARAGPTGPTGPASGYLAGYPPALLAQVQALIGSGEMAAHLARRHPEAHAVRSDPALFEYVQAVKARHMRQSPPLGKVQFDPRLQRLHQALGTHTAISRVQGGQLKAKREIRIAALFKDAPADFLHLIVAHELAHLRHRAHDRAFYALCEHMAPGYAQCEFDLRVWLTLRESAPATDRAATNRDNGG